LSGIFKRNTVAKGAVWRLLNSLIFKGIQGLESAYKGFHFYVVYVAFEGDFVP
jgi:hypothetical protein